MKTLKLRIATAVIAGCALIGAASPALAIPQNFVLNLGGNLGTLDTDFAANIPSFAGSNLLPTAFSIKVGSDIWGLGDLQVPSLTAVTTGPAGQLLDFSLDAINSRGDELAVVFLPDAQQTSFDVVCANTDCRTASGTSVTLTAVPEPAALGLIGSAFLSFAFWRSRRAC